MSFMQLDGINDLREPTMAPEGEYALMITHAEVKDSKNSPGREVIHCRIEFTDHDEYASFMHWVAMPSKKLDIDENSDGPEEGKKKYTRMALGVKRFLNLFSIAMDDGFATEDLMGACAIAGVAQEERSDDPSKVNQRLIVPRIRED